MVADNAMGMDIEFKILGSTSKRRLQNRSGKHIGISYYNDLHGRKNPKQTFAVTLDFVVVQGVSAVVRRCTYHNRDLRLSGYCAVTARC
jgi:hypothetical protein